MFACQFISNVNWLLSCFFNVCYDPSDQQRSDQCKGFIFLCSYSHTGAAISLCFINHRNKAMTLKVQSVSLWFVRLIIVCCPVRAWLSDSDNHRAV